MRKLMVVVFGGILGLGACGYADPISQSRYGGVLALQGDEDIAMDEAEKLMLQHCGSNNYRIERIDKVLVDEEDYVHTERHPDGTSDTVAGTEEAWEIHVTYSCLVPQTPPR